jgi:hypothetical protein
MKIAFPEKKFDVPTIRPTDCGFDVYYRDGRVERYDRGLGESDNASSGDCGCDNIVT